MPPPALPLNLVGLQNRLDALAVGEKLTIATADYHRLFGLNDAGRQRLSHFAQGHGCTAEPREGSLTFHKARATG